MKYRDAGMSRRPISSLTRGSKKVRSLSSVILNLLTPRLDGSLYITTPIDPMFLMLLRLEKCKKSVCIGTETALANYCSGAALMMVYSYQTTKFMKKTRQRPHTT